MNRLCCRGGRRRRRPDQDAGASEPDKVTTIGVTLSDGCQSGAYADGDAGNDTGERVQLDALGEFALSLLGGSYVGATGVLTISFRRVVGHRVRRRKSSGTSSAHQ